MKLKGHISPRRSYRLSTVLLISFILLVHLKAHSLGAVPARDIQDESSERSIVTDEDEQKVREYVSDHEIPKRIPTKLKIVGDLATPPPNSPIKVPFVPKQTYIQVRRTEKETHLPRSAAIAEARTEEELLNAPRLREAISHLKNQEVYEEKGYEDTGYDHDGFKKTANVEEKIKPASTAHHKKRYYMSLENADHPVNEADHPAQNRLQRRRIISHSSNHSERMMSSSLPKKNFKTHHRHKNRNAEANIAVRNEKKLQPQIIFANLSSNDEEITPTTYHPRVLKAPSSTTPLPKKLPAVAFHFKLPKISEHGYKFVNPFEDITDTSDLKQERSQYPKSIFSQSKWSIYYKPLKKAPLTKNTKAHQYQVHEPSLDSQEFFNVFYLSPKVDSKLKPKNKLKSVSIPTKKFHQAKEKRRIKPDFPYPLIGEKSKSLVMKPKKKSLSIFGEPDESPWVPIIPKDAYQFHGFSVAPSSKRINSNIQVYDFSNPNENVPHIPNASVAAVASSSSEYDDSISSLITSPTGPLSSPSTLPSHYESAQDDIQTQPSDQYSIFQLPTAISSLETTNKSTSTSVFGDKLYRHPTLPKENSAPNNTTESSTSEPTIQQRRDISITHSNRIPKDGSHKLIQPVVVYPQDFFSSAKFIENLTLAQFSPTPQLPISTPTPPNDIIYGKTKRSKRSTGNSQEEVVVSIAGITTQIPVDVEKYPFYKSISPDSLAKYSVLRYITNPLNIPNKRRGDMAFYASRNNIDCSKYDLNEEIQPSKGGLRAPSNPRVHLNDKIQCLKTKFFGDDPLDNPFFKEDIVGVPKIFASRPKPILQNHQLNTTTSFLFTNPKSPIRKWIDSLAPALDDQPTTLIRRSDNNEPEVSLDNLAGQRKQKVYFVGGFINRDSDSHPIQVQNNKSDAVGTSTSSTSMADDTVEVTTLQQEVTSTSTSSNDTSEKSISSDETAETPIPLEIITPLSPTNTENTELMEIPVSSRIVNKPAPVFKKYVDAVSTLRNIHNILSKPESTSMSMSQNTFVPVKLQYKEPTWRQKKSKFAATNNELDSLLYVIDPKSGQGRWMKLLKVDDLTDRTNGNILKETVPIKHSPMTTENGTSKSQQIQSNRDIPLKNINITDLMMKIAPLKAHQIEINSLLSPRESIRDEIEENLDENYSTMLEVDEDLPTVAEITTNPNILFKIPDPHDRLYYYVEDK